MKLLFGLALTLASFSVCAQSEEESIKKTVNQLFSGMRERDTVRLKEVFAPAAMLQTIARSKEGNELVRTEPISGFIKSIGSGGKQLLDERIEFASILTDGPLASVWTPYKFYVDNQFSHCGVNSFQLVKLNGEWKIQYIIDTRRKEGCL